MAPAAAADDEPIRLASAPNVLSLYWVENVAVLVWHETGTAAVIEALHASAAPQRERYPSGMSCVHLGRVQLSIMDGPARCPSGTCR